MVRSLVWDGQNGVRVMLKRAYSSYKELSGLRTAATLLLPTDLRFGQGTVWIASLCSPWCQGGLNPGS